jgi:DNA/RNA-binding domain of Phe-tRNA-synthetase-like protein
MSLKEIETAALKLGPKERARLAERLLESLEDLSEGENEIIWADEAERRHRMWNSSDDARTANKVLRKARTKLI